jgi:hypothetical protein
VSKTLVNPRTGRLDPDYVPPRKRALYWAIAIVLFVVIPAAIIILSNSPLGCTAAQYSGTCS